MSCLVKVANTAGLRLMILLCLAVFSVQGASVSAESKPCCTNGLLAFHLDFNTLQFKRETILNLLRRAADDGYNAVLWEIENKVRWESCPEVVAPDAFTKDEFRGLLEEAKKLGLEPIPLMQTFGHAEYVLDCDKYKPMRECHDRKNCYCPSNPESRKFLKRLLHEYLEVFGNDVKRFHLGGDEAYGYGSCPLCKNRDKIGLYVEHLDAVSEELRQRGIRPFVWHDMLQHFDGTCESFSRLPRNYGIWYWEYFPVRHYYWNATSEKALRREAAAGREIVFCPSVQCYLDDPFLVKYNLHRANVAEAVDAVRRCGLAGLCMTSWSCHSGSKMLQIPLMDFAAMEFRHADAEGNWRTAVHRNFGDMPIAALDALTDWDNALGAIDGRYGTYKDAALPKPDLIEKKADTDAKRADYIKRAQKVVDDVEAALKEIRAAGGAKMDMSRLLIEAGELKSAYHRAQIKRIKGEPVGDVPLKRTRAFYGREQSDMTAERSVRRAYDPITSKR